MRRAAKLDANHAEIVDAFERHGFSVLSLARVGNGCPDLLVGRAGHLMFVEVKDGAKAPSRRALTPAQQEFHELWPVHVVTGIEDVTRLATYALRVTGGRAAGPSQTRTGAASRPPSAGRCAK